MILFELQSTVSLVLGVALLAMQLYALLESIRYRTDAYPAAGKLTKPAWVGICAVAVAIGFLSVQAPLSLFEIIAVVASGVFLADVRPALRRVLGKSRSDGPYGPW